MASSVSQQPRRADRSTSAAPATGAEPAAGVALSPANPPPRNPWLRRVLLVNLVLEIGIVITGGLVRLTGSGLGCPTWPQCVPGSFAPVAHQAQGFHKVIEFGNRTLTFVVSVAAIAVVLAVWRWARERRSLRALSFLPLLGVALQAVIGGLSVLTGLNPAIVAGHFLVSMVLIAVSTLLLYRAGEGDAPSSPTVRGEVRALARVTTGLGALVLVLGTVVTGSGPHSGDAAHPTRFGFDPRSVSWLHADAVMLFLGLVVAVLVAVRLTTTLGRPRQAWLVVLAVTLAQGVVGYTQYFAGLPEAVVMLHMLGASILVVALTRGVLTLRVRDAAERVGTEGGEPHLGGPARAAPATGDRLNRATR